MFLTHKTKVIIVSISLVVLIISISTIVFIIFSYSRSIDLTAVSQTKRLASSMELYFDKFNDYPISEEINAKNIKYITERGINEEGKYLYFKKDFIYARSVSFVSTRNSYTIKFNLKNKWPLWNLNTMKGGKCSIKENLIFSCK